MILIDTSAWVEFLRDTGTVCNRVDTRLDGDFATCHPIRITGSHDSPPDRPGAPAV